MGKTIRMLLRGVVGAYALSSTGTALAGYLSATLVVTDAPPGGRPDTRSPGLRRPGDNTAGVGVRIIEDPGLFAAAGRAPGNAGSRELRFQADAGRRQGERRVHEPGTGQPRWRLLATPYTPGLGSLNAAGTVEAQSVIGFPRSATLRKPAVKAVNGFVRLRISGAVNLPIGAPATLRLYRGVKSASGASIVLRKSGNAYSGTLRIRQTGKAQVVFLQTRADVAASTVPCVPTFGLPCLAGMVFDSATRAAIAVRSNAVRVVIPAQKR